MDRSFQPHALTTMADSGSELGNAYLRMLGECKEISTVAQSKDGDHGKAGTTAAPVQPRSLNASEEERKAEQKVWEKVCGIRQARLKFHSVRAGANPDQCSLTDVYQKGGELSNVFKSTKAAKMAGQLESQGQKETRAFILCADTFDYRKQRSAKPSVEWNDEMGHLLKWLKPHMDNHTMVILFDGRSRTCRRKFEDWICEVFPDELRQVELRIIYAGVTAGADPREPKKKVAFSDTCSESVFVGLPMPKTVMKAKPRPSFAGGGDHTTHSQVYAPVPKRSLESLPRLQKAEKEAMIGAPLEDDVHAGLAAVLAAGHPLYLNEVKGVDLLMQLLSDLDVGHVVDLSPTSGALAAAAAMKNITYDGLCFNDMHKQWLEDVTNRTMLKVLTVAEADAKNQDKGLAEDIKKYFAASISDAEKLMSNPDPPNEENDKPTQMYVDEDEDEA